MTDQKIIKSVFPRCKAIQNFPFKEIDTISGKFLGERAMSRYEVLDAGGKKHDIVIKHKNSFVVPLGALELSPSFGVFLKVIWAHRIFGFNNGRNREKVFYEKIDDCLREFLPQFLGAYESLGGQKVSLAMMQFSQSREISFNDLYRIIDLITDFHKIYYDKQNIIKEMKLNHYTVRDYRRARSTLRALFSYYYDDNIRIYGKKLVNVMSDFIDHIDEEYMTVMEFQTLTHNDFTPRNICINGKRIIIYDWELACYQNPEHDLVELLFTTSDDTSTPVQIRKMITYYRKQLANKTCREVSDEEFARLMRFNALEYCVNRLAIFRSYSKKNHNNLVDRCEKNARKVLEACL